MPLWQIQSVASGLQLMPLATREIACQNPDVKKVLLATRDLILRPDHHQEPNTPAAWHYFDILMEIRSEYEDTLIP